MNMTKASRQPDTPFCPMRGARCLKACAWNTPGGCALNVLAVQSARQANEMYIIAEIMNGSHAEPVDALPDGVWGQPLQRREADLCGSASD